MKNFVPSDESFEKIGDHLFRCVVCGAEIESGIARISKHWVNCGGKSFHQKLITKATWPVEEIENLKKSLTK